MAKLVKLSRGLQGQIKAWEKLAASDLSKLVLDAGEVVAKAAISEVQQSAASTPGWERPASALRVGRSAENVVVWIPPGDPVAREGYDLEYGTEDRPPAPVLLTTLTRTQKTHAALFASTLGASLLSGRR